MSEQAKSKRICPYLGLTDDPYSRFAYPDSAHRCFAAGQLTTIPLEHQTAFCMSQRYPTCPRFVDVPVEAGADSTERVAGIYPPHKRSSLWLSALLGVVGLVIGLAVILGLYFASRESQPDGPVVVISTPQNQVTPTGTPQTGDELAPAGGIEDTSTPLAVAVAETPTATPSPTPDALVEVFELSPLSADIGWVTDIEERGNHFGDSYLYAGVFNGQIFNSAFLFDLSTVPRGAPIEYAAIEMTGLRDDRLATQSDQSNAAGVWALRMLRDEQDLTWRRLSFQDIFNISSLQTLSPILGSQDLAPEKTNVFELSPTQIDIIENRIIDKEAPTLSFRVEGPLVGPDNLFAWDTGYGSESGRNKVKLILRVGEPPATPPVFDFLLVTSTPTPENILTAAAVAVQLTADATRVGTATPLPSNAVTPTPFPEYLVIIPTPTAQNTATLEALEQLATAIALTTGTATPVATDAVTATPTPTPTITPTPTLPRYVLITSTPTPETIFEAATLSARATALATRIGTATPLPEDWATPIVVTATPTPLNQATAQAMIDIAIAAALTTGTPTPIPSNVVTATPTPVFEAIPLLLSATPGTPTPVPPDLMPAMLIGKILFKSDRESEDGEDFVYMYDPATGTLGRLTASWPYEMAQIRDEYSADTVYRAYVKQLLWTNERQDILAEATAVPNTTPDSNATPEMVLVDRIYTQTEEFAIHRYDYKFKQEDIVTRAGTGVTYDPAWSPVSNEIVYVSTETQNEEIWVVNSDGTGNRQLTQNTWEWDKSPSWSPDGQQIVFMSNRTGNQQLWIMNADGSDQRLLMGWDNWTPYNDWDPVWVKYPNPAPPEDQPR